MYLQGDVVFVGIATEFVAVGKAIFVATIVGFSVEVGFSVGLDVFKAMNAVGI
jgi:hypothetical protein